MYLDIEVSQVIFVRNGTNPRDPTQARSAHDGMTLRVVRAFLLRLGHQTFSLFHDPFWQSSHDDSLVEYRNAWVLLSSL